jgi:DNA-binding NarL/FixJ family response regulator
LAINLSKVFVLKILIADDHPLYREGLSRLVADLDGDPVIVEAGDFTETLSRIQNDGPFDLILCDLRMPGGEAIPAIRNVISQSGDMPVVVVSGFETRQNVEGSLEAGARGFLPKSTPPAVMLNALQLVLLGEIYVPKSLITNEYGSGGSENTGNRPDMSKIQIQIDMLTQRQRGVLALIGQGMSNRDIAGRLDISEGTVKVHVGAILKTLDVNNRTQAALAATELGITPLDDDRQVVAK